MIRLLLLEWKMLWLDRRLPAVLACSVALTALAVWSTARSNAVTAKTSVAAEQAEYERWLGQGPRYAHAAAHYGMHVFRPTTRLQNFDPGVTPYVGETVFLEAHVQDPLLYRPADDRIAVPGLGDLTPAALDFTVLPLFFLLIGFNIVAGDATAGAGWLTQVSARSTTRLLGSKVMAIFLPSATVSALLPLLSLAAAALSTQAGLPGEPARWLVLIGLCLFSAAFWSVLTVTTSGLSRTSGQSLAVLLACWVLICVLLPRGLAAVAAAIHPTINQQSLSSEIKQATSEGEDGDREERLKEALFHRYGVTSLEALPVEWDGLRRQAAEEAGNTIFDTFWGRLFSQYSSQESLAAKLSVFSPVTALTIASETMSGSHITDHTAFITQAEQHRRLIQRTMNSELTHKRSPSAGFRPNASPDLWKRVPPFHYVAPSWFQSATRTGHAFWFATCAIVIQAAFAAGLFALAVRRKQVA